MEVEIQLDTFPSIGLHLTFNSFLLKYYFIPFEKLYILCCLTYITPIQKRKKCIQFWLDCGKQIHNYQLSDM